MRRLGIRDENIHVFTDTTTKPELPDDKTPEKPWMSSARLFGSRLTKLARQEFGGKSGKTGGKKFFLMVYMSGHGCSEDNQFFLLNSKSDVILPIESKLRALAEAYDCRVLAVYDICRSNKSLYMAKKKTQKRGIEEETVKEPEAAPKEANYMHLGAPPR